MIKIYHNPRCSKSRATLALLEEKGIAPEIHTYLDGTLSTADLADLMQKLGLTDARQLMRRKDTLYKELDLDSESLSQAQLLATLQQNIALLERPIVVNGNQAAFGRPPEQVLEIL